MVSQGVILGDGAAGEDCQRVIDAVREVAEHLGVPVVLVVVDTLARTLGAADENKATDIGRVVNAADKVRHETGAAFAFIDHSGLSDGGRVRGSSAKYAAWDVEAQTKRGWPHRGNPLHQAAEQG